MKACYFFIFNFIICIAAASAQPTIGFSTFLSGLTAPVDIVHAGDATNRLFIVQQNGIIRLHSGGTLLAAPFLNMNGLVRYSGEQGLLSMAFHPDYETNGYFFVYYNNPSGSIELAQYHVSATDANVADPASRRILLTIPKPFSNHNGGKLNFGPDGNLYFGTGDGGDSGDPNNYAQNLNILLGKMIRINVDNFNVAPYYTVPATNPLVGMANTQPEIYAWGLRNPWRWNFDRANGDMWIADVGQNAREEVNYIPAAATSGLNYGWRCYEGNSSYNLSDCGSTPLTGKTFPIFEYPHSAAGGYSITGGLVYRGTEYPSLQGYYICADYVNPNGWLIKSNGAGGWNVTQQTNFPADIITFGDAEDGTLYMSTNGGTIYKITATPAVLPVRLLSFEAGVQNGKDVLKWKTTSDQALIRFDIEQSTDARDFRTVGAVPPVPGNIGEYFFTTAALPANRFYRLKMIYNNGVEQYTHTLGLTANEFTGISATGIAQGQLQLITPAPLERATITDLQGRVLQGFDHLGAGTHLLNTGNMLPGIYLLQCVKQDHTTENIRLYLN